MIPRHVEKFCDNFKKLRESSDDTIDLRAEPYREFTGMNISKRNMERFFSKKDLPNDINISTVLEVAKYYGVSIDWLIGREKLPDDVRKRMHAKEVTGLSEKAVKKLENAKNDPRKKQLVKSLSDIIEDPITDQYADVLISGIKASEDTLREKAEAVIEQRMPESKQEMRILLDSMFPEKENSGISDTLSKIVSEVIVNRVGRKISRKYKTR